MKSYKITKLNGAKRDTFSTLSGCFSADGNGREKFLFVSPHDDDAITGGGLAMQAAVCEGIDVYLLIVTDGSMGYCTQEQRDTIADIRRKETYSCYQSIGLMEKNIIWLGYPDCRINLCRGRRNAEKNDPNVIAGFTGLQNSFTYALRQISPTRCFLPTIADLHPDHRYVYEEFMISIFHAAGTIWPELGEPLVNVPNVYEMAVYCDLPLPPNIQIAADDEFLEKKIEGINKFASQTQIASLVEIVRKNGSYEYFRELGFNLYSPSKYRRLFE
jgi:LmbE family N-acetylglucosaminyl deacetylase